MKNDILFSIIVPVYNTEKYLLKCLNSIKQAMDLDCEVIIVNDGSTDNSEKVIKDFMNTLPKEYKEKFIYKYKKNKGLADTKNVGIELAKGKYISVIDSDDYISDDFYAIARKYINEGFEIIVYDLYVIYENKHKKIDKTSKEVENINYTARAYREDKNDLKLALICGAMQGSSCNKIIKKELYSSYKFPTNKEYEDTAVTPFILVDAEKIKYIPYPLYFYLQREKSIVATNTYISAFYKICENLSSVLKSNGEYEKYKMIIDEFFVDRMLETLYEHYKKNKKEFNLQLKLFGKNNKETIDFILKNKMAFNEQNFYSERQKKLVNDIFEYIYRGEYRKVNKKFFSRRLVNYVRKVYREIIQLFKVIIGRV